MFTGIIETLGTVASLTATSMKIEFPLGAWNTDLITGESISVNGCCLTAVNIGGNFFDANLSEETLIRTSFRQLQPGRKVNLERAMRADGRFGGHIVQGHVDGVGKYVSVRDEGISKVLTFELPQHLSRYLVDKCSITIEGISLTVVRPHGHQFEVWIIPHTWENTNLSELKPGETVNIEIDLIARYVENLLMKTDETDSLQN